MTAFTAFFRPLVSRSGVQITSTSAAIGTGGLALTATATVSIHVPVPAAKSKLLALTMTAKLAAAGGSTITAQAFKRNNVPASPADVTLTAAKDITATVITTADKSYPIAITGTDAQTLFQSTDTLRIDVAAATTVTQAPQIVISAQWAVLA